MKLSNPTKGILWIITPVVTIILTLATFAIINTVMQGAGPEFEVVKNIINFALSIIGFFAVIGIPVGFIIGITKLAQKNPSKDGKYDDRSGKGEDSTIPEEIQGWNWGAAGLSWIWGAAHSVWISFLAFIPIVGFVMIFVLGAKGNEMAWKANKWGSVEEFMESQRKWKPWGIFFFILGSIVIILNIGLSLLETSAY